MIPAPVTDDDRRLFAAIRRDPPCPGCRWCRTRRVLTAVLQVLAAAWRVLVMASKAVVAVGRGLLVDAGVAAVVIAVYREDGHLLGIGAAGSWLLLRVGMFVRDMHIKAGRR